MKKLIRGIILICLGSVVPIGLMFSPYKPFSIMQLIGIIIVSIFLYSLLFVLGLILFEEEKYLDKIIKFLQRQW